MALAAHPAYASEELIAAVSCKDSRCAAEPTVFGKVEIEYKITRGEEGTTFSALSVNIRGKKISVPEAELNRILKVDPPALRVTSEIGYPSEGLGPNLYLKIPGVCGDNPSGLSGPADCRFTFSETGFVGLERSAR